MIISVNWLKCYVDIDVSTNELVELIGERLVEVEEIIDLGEKYQGIKIVEVKTAEKVEGSDHLTKCMIFDGENEHQLVCGAPNVKVGMLAVWLPPKTTLPETFNKEPLVLDKRKIMGVESAGMLAALDELDLGEDHDGIVEIDPDMAKPGDDFTEVFGLDDTLLDIENKSLTHRPDCFGVVGFAREVAGILGKEFKESDFLKKSKQDNFGAEISFNIEIADSALCPRYEAAVMSLPAKYPKKYLTRMQTNIARSGMRSIDPVVDSTNDLMLLTGQPLHAFDYDKLVKIGGLETAKIIVRAAKEGEKLELLDGKNIELDPKDIIITSNNIPVALAGAMGGASTMVDKNTKRIIIESATFNLFNLRGTQFRHGIFSEAITRFTKGQPASLTDYVLRKFIAMTEKHFGLRSVSEIKDAYPKEVSNKPIIVSVEKINNVLGSSFMFDDVVTTLENVGFKVKLDSDSLKITAPWWRTDIHIAEDIVEEVGRLNGFTNIPLSLPTRSFVAPATDELGNLKKKIRESLSAMGANEVLTYSFVSEKLLESVGQDPSNSYKIINSISPELQYVRQQILPSLFEKAKENLRAGYKEFALFEMNQVFWKSEGLNDEKVPVQFDNIGIVIVDSKSNDTNYYLAKGYVAELANRLNTTIKFTSRKKPLSAAPYFELKRSADLFVGDTRIGMVGEIKNSVADEFKLPRGTAIIEIAIDLILDSFKNNSSNKTDYAKQSNFPSVERNLTIRIDSNTEYIKLENLITKKLSQQNLYFELNPTSIYQGDNKKFKNISFALSFASYDKTLGAEEIADIMDNIASEIKKELKGEVI